MSILNRNDLSSRLQEMFSDRDDEQTVAFLEDITDTFNDLEDKANPAKYNQLQSDYDALKEKYRQRFFSPRSDEDDKGMDEKPDFDEKPQKLRFEDLFTEVK